jgi:hypothetical protein
MVASEDRKDEDAFRGMMGPGQIDQLIRQAILMC